MGKLGLLVVIYVPHHPLLFRPHEANYRVKTKARNLSHVQLGFFCTDNDGLKPMCVKILRTGAHRVVIADVNPWNNTLLSTYKDKY